MEKRRISYAIALHGQEELDAVTKVLNDHKTIMGENVYGFEEEISQLFAKKYGVMVNSGSSAILLTFEQLNFPEGSEVITPITTFSTTVAPIVQKRLVPVFVDSEEGTYLSNIDQIEEMITDKTKALMIPSLVGNVPDYQRLQQIAKKHNLVLIEDSCDTVGATIDGQSTGEFTDYSITSFYGSHIITAGGNGGMVCVNDEAIARKLRVLRGWGRSSAADENEPLEKRLNYDLDGAPHDSKFIFERLGYNFVPNEMEAAFGRAQLKKLPAFKKTREDNFASLKDFFSKYQDWFILPKQAENVSTAWLGFPLTVKEGAPFTRQEIITYLEENNVQTRPVWSGNILRHPGFKDVACRVREEGYPVGDQVLRQGFLFGCHHGLSTEDIEYLKSLFEEYFKTKAK